MIGRGGLFVSGKGKTIGALASTALGADAICLPRTKEEERDPRRLPADDFVTLLALKATLAKEAKQNADEEGFKSIADEFLQSVDDLRADAEYLWIIERTDAAAAKAKVSAANRFTDRIAAIVGI